MWKSIEYSKEKLNEIIEMTVEYYGKDNDISQKAFWNMNILKMGRGKLL